MLLNYLMLMLCIQGLFYNEEHFRVTDHAVTAEEEEAPRWHLPHEVSES